MGWIIIIGGFLIFGFVVDLIYKRKGIKVVEPKTNGTRVTRFGRINIDSHIIY